MEPIKKLFEKEFFSDLHQKKKEIDFYQNCLQEALPKNLSKAFKVTKYKRGVLYLSTSSNALSLSSSAPSALSLAPSLSSLSTPDDVPTGPRAAEAPKRPKPLANFI